MSERRTKLPAQVFEIVPAGARRPPSPPAHLLAVGVLFPAAVIVIELATRFCAQVLFDPMPSAWHVLAVSFVPASNFIVWRQLRSGGSKGAKWVTAINGTAIAIGGFYAILFAPLMPLAIVAILIYGLGFLPFGPLAAFWGALKLRRTLRLVHASNSNTRALWGGVAAGLVLLLALDLPPAATRYGLQLATSYEPQEQKRGLWVLRNFGDEDLLLRLCYDTRTKPVGLFNWIYFLGSRSGFTRLEAPLTPALGEVREIYYRVYGAAFNSRPAPDARHGNTLPLWGRPDNDLGGTYTGGRLEGLDLASSRLDGMILAADMAAYLEWTLEFKNQSSQDQEVRLQLALPPNGVVSRATLWIDGEEREAAYASRGAARSAYQSVVRQRRDPLLVTSKGPDRVLAQAFPVPRDGGSIKFKIGITAPLDFMGNGRARLILPQIADRNFELPASASHTVWIESKQSLSAALPGLTRAELSSVAFRIKGEITEREFADSRKAIEVELEPRRQPVISRIGDSEIIEQSVERQMQTPPSAIIIIVDGSAHTKRAIPSLLRSLSALPSDARAGLIIAGDMAKEVPLAAWTIEQQTAARLALQSHDFIGGQDNTAALAEAFMRLEPYDNALVLWVHGPQPVPFAKGLSALEHISRLKHLPRLVRYEVEPGPNEALPDTPWAWSATVLPRTDDQGTGLAAFLNKLWQQDELQIVRKLVTGGDSERKGSDHIARLWASEQIPSLLASHKSDEAVALASRYHLVTAVSGAVVLQTAQQYASNNLTQVAPGTVPTLPEPEEWALILLLGLAAALLLRRGGSRLARLA